MSKSFFRTPKDYDGTDPTGKQIQQLIPNFLRHLSESYKDRGDLILVAWSDIIGPKLAPMTKAVSFEEGVLHVKVKNSTLYSLLSQHEKTRLLKCLKDRFPSVMIRNIVFRIG